MSQQADQNFGHPAGPPPDQYRLPEGGFSGAPSNYGPPQSSYGPPQSGYGPPQPGYSQPQSGYGPPGYGPPPPPPGSVSIEYFPIFIFNALINLIYGN